MGVTTACADVTTLEGGRHVACRRQLGHGGLHSWWGHGLERATWGTPEESRPRHRDIAKALDEAAMVRSVLGEQVWADCIAAARELAAVG